MSIRKVKLIDGVRLDNDPTSTSGSQDLQGVTPKRLTLLIQIVMTGAPTNLTLSVDVSADQGLTLIDYDKLITEAGVDGPVSSVVYTATADDIISLSPEDVIDYVRLDAVVTGTSAVKYFTLDAWLIIEY